VDGSNNKESLNLKMPFNEFINEGGVVKSSPIEESNNSMKIKDIMASKH
jgi:hypothetical protein